MRSLSAELLIGAHVDSGWWRSVNPRIPGSLPARLSEKNKHRCSSSAAASRLWRPSPASPAARLEINYWQCRFSATRGQWGAVDSSRWTWVWLHTGSSSIFSHREKYNLSEIIETYLLAVMLWQPEICSCFLKLRLSVLHILWCSGVWKLPDFLHPLTTPPSRIAGEAGDL